MRKGLLSWIGIITSVAGYFFLLDFVRPILEERHLILVWWVTLGLYMILVGGSGFWYVGRHRPAFAAIGFLFIVAAVYLYDPTINSHLESIGLKWFWIAPLTGYFLWLLAWVRTRPRAQNASLQKPPQ